MKAAFIMSTDEDTSHNAMDLQLYYLPPAAESHGQEIIKRLPYMRECVCVPSHFYINLYISFIYKDISIKLTGNVSVQNFGPSLKNKMTTIAEVQNMKTTYRKSWPGNHFQVLNSTFEPCFKVK